MSVKETPRGEESPRHPIAEKVSFGISLLILSLVVGSVLYTWLTPSRQPAAFQIERGETRAEGGRYYLDITVRNTGDETGQNVRVEGRLMVGGKEESASTEFDYIPGHSEEKGVLVFGAEPSGAEITVESYQKPA